MKIHEYQAKKLMAAYNIPVPKGGVAETAEESQRRSLRRLEGIALS